MRSTLAGILVVFSVLVTQAAETPTFHIDGIVVNRNGDAVQAASIEVDGRKIATTSKDGRFALDL